MESPRMQILILGSPVITWDGKPVEISRRQIRLLFYYIASQTVPVSRTKICQLFWPELDEAQALKNMRESLSKLRAELPDPNLIISDEDEISLDTHQVYVDGREFQSLVDPIVTKSNINSGSRLPDWMYKDLRKGIQLCRGAHILEGFNLPDSLGLEAWLSLSNNAYDYYRLRSLEFLAGHCIAIGDLNEAIDWLGKYAEIDPLNSDNQYLILTCLKERGRFKEAEDYIVYLEKIYRTQNEEPLPASIIAFRSRLDEYKQQVKKKEESDWPGRLTNPSVFIGRGELLHKLHQAYHRKGIVSIKGESGSGKSRLMQEFYENLSTRPRLLFCSGKPLIRCSPFEPIIEGMRRFMTTSEWSSMPEAVRNNLSPLFPELMEGLTEFMPGIETRYSGEEIHAVYSGLYSALLKMAEKKPLLLVIDIIQWCDEATLEFLSYLSDREFFKKHGLLIISSRREEVNQTVEIFIDRNTMLYTLESIEVPLFSYEETRAMVQGLLGKDCSEGFLDTVYKATGGNPYFIIEGLRSAQSINFNPDSFEAASFYPIPSTIQALVNEKTRLLSSQTIQVLQSAAILGQKFQPKVVEKMVDLKVDELIKSLEELQKFSILAVESGMLADSHYEFPHDQVREVILRELSPLRKRTLHLKAMDALLAVNGERPELASTYAYHCEQAGETNRAFEFWIKAGQFARSRFSKTDTYYSYEQAGRLIPDLQTDNLAELVVQLVAEWGDYAYDRSDVETCDHIYNLCYQLGEQTQNPLLLGVGLSGQGRVFGMKLEIAQGIERLQRAIYFLDLAGNKAERVEAAARLGILYTLRSQIKHARNTYEDSLEIMPEPRTQREMDVLVNTLAQLGLVYLMTGWPKKALAIGERAFNLSQLIKRRSARVQALALLSAANFYVGNYSQSLTHALSGIELAEKLNLRWWLSFIEIIVARDHLVLGDMDQCWIHIHKVLDREKDILDRTILKGIYIVLGDVYRLLGDADEAARIYRMGAEDNNEDMQTLENTYLLGMVIARGKNPKEGFALISQARTSAQKNDMATVALAAQMAEFFMDPEFSLEDGQLTNLENLANEMEQRGFGTSHIFLDIIKGSLAQKQERISEAEKYFQKVRDFGADHSHIWIELFGHQYLHGLYPPGSKQHSENRIGLKILTDRLRERCALPPLRRLYSAYRKSLNLS